MYVYLIMLFLVVGLANNKKPALQQKKRYWMALIPLVIISSFRFGIGTDYYSYNNYFLYGYASSSWNMEWLFRVVVTLLMQISKSTKLVFSFFSILTIFLVCVSLKEDFDNYPESLFLYICLGFFFSSMNAIRQNVAIAIVFYSSKFLVSREIKKYLICIILASGFHITALLAVVLILFTRVYDKHIYIMIAMIAILLPLFQAPIDSVLIKVFPDYARYIKRGDQALSILEAVINTIMYLSFLALGFNSISQESSSRLILSFNCIFISFLLYAAGWFVPYIDRISLYFEIFLICYVPSVLKEYPVHLRRTNKMIINLLVFFRFIIMIGVAGRYGVIPYQTFLLQ